MLLSSHAWLSVCRKCRQKSGRSACSSTRSVLGIKGGGCCGSSCRHLCRSSQELGAICPLHWPCRSTAHFPSLHFSLCRCPLPSSSEVPASHPLVFLNTTRLQCHAPNGAQYKYRLHCSMCATVLCGAWLRSTQSTSGVFEHPRSCARAGERSINTRSPQDWDHCICCVCRACALESAVQIPLVRMCELVPGAHV